MAFWGMYLSTATTDSQVRLTHEYMRKFCNTYGDKTKRYYRFSPNFYQHPECPKELKLDAYDKDSMKIFKETAQKFFDNPEFLKVVELIKNHRNPRHV